MRFLGRGSGTSVFEEEEPKCLILNLPIRSATVIAGCLGGL